MMSQLHTIMIDSRVDLATLELLSSALITEDAFGNSPMFYISALGASRKFVRSAVQLFGLPIQRKLDYEEWSLFQEEIASTLHVSDYANNPPNKYSASKNLGGWDNTRLPSSLAGDPDRCDIGLAINIDTII